MKILVSGSSGLVGTALVEALLREGHAVCRLMRPQSARKPGGPQAIEVRWDPISGELDSAAAEGAQAAVHLAGASIAERWTDARKRVLRSSRVDATRQLVAALAKLGRPPAVFVSASAIGYYGDRGDEELTETSAPGTDFLAVLARDWEAEAARAEGFGARVAILRQGVILAPHGGALPRMLLPFRLGLGGRLGSGKQWMSWLTLDEVVGIIRAVLENAGWRGPINAVAPNPVRNAEFTTILGRVLHRPTLFPAPAMALRLALGEMAQTLLLASQRVLPKKLQEFGYNFRQPELEPALSALLRRAA
jgi:uncharacterized protein (TIGR01777 family)